ncbi:MAG TPA: glycosyltransferase family 2 protein [Acetobacteraceae bacterium]|nr:glycosyltransferase family 2 protein [Acetobacteraceae bacterium]
MRVVGVSRVLNEADLIEPFIRHHAALLDLHIVLDGGSTDATVDILRALHDEGIKLQVFQTTSPIFVEHVHSTGLYRLAVGAGADWVLFLDADELLVTRQAARPHDILGLAPADIACLRIPVFRYAAPPPGAGHPLTRLTRRELDPHMFKIAARRLDPARISVYAGNHGAFVDGVADLGLSQDRLVLAHLPDRLPLQSARKAILGRLKAIASGAQVAAAFNSHIEPAFQALKQDPRAWLEAAARGIDAPVEDPVAYRGGPLLHTSEPDELARLLALFAGQGEVLARTFGEIMDRKRLVRRELFEKAAVARRLF